MRGIKTKSCRLTMEETVRKGLDGLRLGWAGLRMQAGEASTGRLEMPGKPTCTATRSFLLILVLVVRTGNNILVPAKLGGHAPTRLSSTIGPLRRLDGVRLDE